MIYSDFHENIFKNDVNKALKSVRRVLDVDSAANIHLAEEIDHDYVDKYKLADLIINITIIALMNVFAQLGLTKEILRSIDTSKEITIRFSATELCTFINEESVDEGISPFVKVIEENTIVSKEFGTDETTTKKSTIERIVHRVIKKHFKIETNWELSIYSGTDIDNRSIIQKRNGATCEYVHTLPNNGSKSNPGRKQDIGPPFPPKKEHAPRELSLTWLLQHVDSKEEELKSHFAIDTSPDNAKTKTPVRNTQVEQAVEFFQSAMKWKEALFFHRYKKYGTRDLNRDQFTDDEIFVPVLPLLVDQTTLQEKEVLNQTTKDESWIETKAMEPGTETLVSLPSTTGIVHKCEGGSLLLFSPVLSVADTTSFLNEQVRTLSKVLSKLQEQFSDPETTIELVSSTEAKIVVLGLHIDKLVNRFLASIQYVETMLEQQLLAAIGKEVNNSDLDKFMKYHNNKILNPSPNPFCYTIRQPKHYPDGILSIEETETGTTISTHVREIPSANPIEVPLNAATTIQLTGKIYLHGWLNHQFGHTPSNSFRLNARARQFSSFLLLVGTMSSSGIQPKDAIILRNKDEVHIPLLLNEIPTATEFKDAIQSLSPEQQRFAESFRSMQLDSSVLGVCVIQIKPQLEKLLGLPQDSLTKEMKLTEDLTELFIFYQVPSDLVSCDYEVVGTSADDSDTKSSKDQVANVREHVRSVMDAIATQKKEQLEEQVIKTSLQDQEQQQQQQKFNKAETSVKMESYSLRGSYGNRGKMKCTGRSFNDDSFGGAPERGAMSAAPAPATEGLFGASTASAGGALPNSNSNNYMDSETLHSRDNSANFKDDVAPSPSENNAIVFTEIPKVLDRAIELHDKNTALRSTTIETTGSWSRIRQKNLLSITVEGRLDKSCIASEKSKAFDLLDALSRSGSLAIPFSELHVVICATHRFEKNVMETVIQDNINPIEKLEMSTLLMASTILGIPVRNLIHCEKKRKELEMSFPLLLGPV